MPKRLSAAEVDTYHENGVHFPLRVMSADEAGALAARFQANSDVITGRKNQKPHLLYPFLDQLIRDPRILDPVEDLLGPDIWCWGTQFFAKPAGDPAYTSWHQDGTYWGLSSTDIVTAWVALTPSTQESGCLQVVPGTHHEQVAHQDKFEESNMLSRGQEIAVEVDPAKIVNVELQPGEMSLHHVLLFHGSEKNRAKLPRIGFAIRYMATHVRQKSPHRETATLVRGSDAFGHFDRELSPEADMHPDAVSRHDAIIESQLKILYEGAQQQGKLGPGKGAKADSVM